MLLFISCGDEEKEFLENTYQRYSKYIYKFHFIRLKNVQAAECAMMDTFLRIIENVDTLMESSESELKRNISVYAMQVFLNTKKKEGRRESLTVLSISDVIEEEENELELQVEDKCDLLEQLLQKELLDKLVAEIKKLDKRSQEIMLYKVQYDMRNKDIANKMGMNQSTVNTIVSRIYKQLRKEMEGYINV